MNGHVDNIDSRYDAEEEKRLIITKYEDGRVKGTEILSWEDPALEVYHVMDRYGFIHDHRLPEKLSAFEAKVREVENERLTKWLKMLKKWDHFKDGVKLKSRVYKGIPNAIRGEVWARLLGVTQIKQEQEGKYEEMRKQARIFSDDIKQIDLDVNRTFRNNIMFRERYGVKQQALFQVLSAYSVYNSEVGYCQGMSQIAALLLMFMSDEDAFWALSIIMTDNKHAMHGFFIPGFPKLKRFQDHHDKIIEKLLPKLKKHFDKFDIHSSLYTLKWFFQCFLDRVPFTLTLRLWDIFMMEGELVLTAMSYTLLKLHRKTILKMDMEDLLEFLQIRLEQNFGYHDDAAIEALQASMDELGKHRLLKPGNAPNHELPQRPFGLITNPSPVTTVKRPSKMDVGPVLNGTAQNRGSKNLKPADDDVDPFVGFSLNASPAETSPASTPDSSGFSSPAITSDIEFPLHRAISLYDNVDVDESIQAANRQSTVSEKTNSEKDTDITFSEKNYWTHSTQPGLEVALGNSSFSDVLSSANNQIVPVM